MAVCSLTAKFGDRIMIDDLEYQNNFKEAIKEGKTAVMGSYQSE
jgi:hypothetical protein